MTSEKHSFNLRIETPDDPAAQFRAFSHARYDGIVINIKDLKTYKQFLKELNELIKKFDLKNPDNSPFLKKNGAENQKQ